LGCLAGFSWNLCLTYLSVFSYICKPIKVSKKKGSKQRMTMNCAMR
jgi:hypothetical protein